jgi:hypothetical protein
MMRTMTWWLLAAVLAGGGCSVRNDPGYNRYAPADGDATIMERLEHAMDRATEAVDNADRRMENAVY